MNIADVWHIFTKGIKLLVVIALIGAIIGGALGAYMAKESKGYSATLKFSLTPTDDTDALLYNLQSELFAEKLLLEDNGLPKKEECDAEDYEAALAAIEAFNEARADKKEARRKFNRLLTNVVEFQMKHYDQEYTKIFEQLNTYKSANSDAIASDESHKAMIEKLEGELAEIVAQRSKFVEEEYTPIMLKKSSLQEQVTLTTLAVNDARREADALSEKVIAPWRESEAVQSKVAAIMNSVSYEYAKLETSDASASKNNVQNKGYIKIYVSTTDAALADFIVERLKECVGPFVEAHIEEITSVVQVDCVLISTFSEPNQTGDNIVKKAATFAVIGAVACFVLAFVILIFKELLAMYSKPEDLCKITEADEKSNE